MTQFAENVNYEAFISFNILTNNITNTFLNFFEKTLNE